MKKSGVKGDESPRSTTPRWSVRNRDAAEDIAKFPPLPVKKDNDVTRASYQVFRDKGASNKKGDDTVHPIRVKVPLPVAIEAKPKVDAGSRVIHKRKNTEHRQTLKGNEIQGVKHTYSSIKKRVDDKNIEKYLQRRRSSAKSKDSGHKHIGAHSSGKKRGFSRSTSAGPSHSRKRSLAMTDEDSSSGARAPLKRKSAAAKGRSTSAAPSHAHRSRRESLHLPGPNKKSMAKSKNSDKSSEVSTNHEYSKRIADKIVGWDLKSGLEYFRVKWKTGQKDSWIPETKLHLLVFENQTIIPEFVALRGKVEYDGVSTSEVPEQGRPMGGQQ